MGYLPSERLAYARCGRMGKLSPKHHAAIDGLVAELGVIHVGAPSAIAAVLPALRRLTELDALVCMCPVEKTTGWAVERFDCDNLPNDSRFKQLSISFLDSAPRRFGWFDANRPEPAQRNTVLHLDDLVPRGELEASAAYRQVLVPLRLHTTQQVRALICDGPSLLAWFGAFHSERATPLQVDLLIAMIPALRRRLSIERRLEATHLASAALELMLDQLGAPAFIVTATGRILEANQLGRAMLDARRGEVSVALAAALARHPMPTPVELVRIRERGADCWLAVMRPRTPDTRVANAIQRAATRFKLTSRQRQVLELVIRGETNTAIAAMLGISERAIEQHVSAMFDRTGMPSRAGLVSFVLLGR